MEFKHTIEMLEHEAARLERIQIKPAWVREYREVVVILKEARRKADKKFSGHHPEVIKPSEFRHGGALWPDDYK
jgi:hypothetical protein